MLYKTYNTIKHATKISQQNVMIKQADKHLTDRRTQQMWNGHRKVPMTDRYLKIYTVSLNYLYPSCKIAFGNSKTSWRSSATKGFLPARRQTCDGQTDRQTDKQTCSRTVLLTLKVYRKHFFFQFWWQIIRVTDEPTKGQTNR